MRILTTTFISALTVAATLTGCSATGDTAGRVPSPAPTSATSTPSQSASAEPAAPAPSAVPSAGAASQPGTPGATPATATAKASKPLPQQEETNEPRQQDQSRKSPAESATPASSAAAVAQEPQVGDIVEGGGGKIWWPSYKTLPFEEDTTKAADRITFSSGSGWQPGDWELALDFYSQPFPKHQCKPLDEAPDDATPEQRKQLLQQEGGSYINCLYDSWRPYLESQGLRTFDEIQVSVCPGPSCGAGLVDALAWAGPQEVMIDESLTTFVAGHQTRILAHETGHVVQHAITRQEDGGGVLGIGFRRGKDSGRDSADNELQAECFAAGMLSASRKLDYVDYVAEFGAAWPSHDHGDDQSLEFWTRQGLKGLAGECNPYIADSSLVTSP